MSGREIKWHVLKNRPVRFGEKIQHHVYGPCMGWLQQLWVLQLHYSWLRKAPQNLSRVDLDGQSWLRWTNKPIQLIQSLWYSFFLCEPCWLSSRLWYVMDMYNIHIYIYVFLYIYIHIYIYIYNINILYITYKGVFMNAVLAFRQNMQLSNAHQDSSTPQQKAGRWDYEIRQNCQP